MKRKISLFICIVSTIACFSQNAYEENIKKANEGDMVAQYEIGNFFAASNDYEQAFSWYMKAANQGHLDSQHKVGYYYTNGYGVKQDFTLALFWYNKAAAHGYHKSKCNIGWCYENGKGVPQDYSLAVYWYRKAAEQGNDLAQGNLGTCYYFGRGVEKDLVQAVYWYRKAAEQGEARSQSNLGSCYLNGEGVEKDLYQAEYWIGKAAEQGYERALSLVPKVLSKINEQNNVKLQTTEESSLSTVVDYNIPITDKVGINCYAVIIGNEKYQNEVDVLYAENDAKIFKEYVKQTLGVPDSHIKYITNGTLNSIRIAVKWLAQAMDVSDGNSQAIFYYAGHSIPDESNKSAYLLPVDGIGSDPESAYSIDRLYGELERIQAKKVMVFLDACFSGAKREEGMLASARGVAIKAKLAVPKGNMIIFTAAQGDETAYPFKDQRHGLFTYFLLRKLRETKGDVTLGDLADYLQNEVKRHSFIENKKMQTPTVTASQSVANSWKEMKLQ